MKAIANLGVTSTIELVERAESVLSAEDEVKLQVLRVWICGTGREEAVGRCSKPPAGQTDLLPAGTVISFTFHWMERDRWEESNFFVRIG